MHPRDEQDLRWYFAGWYEGEMGMRSSMGAMLANMERGYVGGQSGPPDLEMGERAMEAAERESRVRRALAVVKDRHPDSLKVLRVVYGPEQRHVEGWGPPALAAALLLVGVAHEEYSRSKTKLSLEAWLVRQAKAASHNASAKARIVRITIAANQLLARASMAYKAALASSARRRRSS
jgi:hypothetical protein